MEGLGSTYRCVGGQTAGTIRRGLSMPQLVFEFWSQEIEPVVEAIKLILDGHPTENHVAPHSLHYEPVQRGMDWAAQQVYAGHIASFVARPKSGGIRYASESVARSRGGRSESPVPESRSGTK
jgi:hypothetical protein